jgi:hypothetical protein
MTLKAVYTGSIHDVDASVGFSFRAMIYIYSNTYLLLIETAIYCKLIEQRYS